MSIRDTVSSDKRVSTVATGRRLSIPERGQGTGVTIQVLNVDNISAYEVHFEGAVIDGGATTATRRPAPEAGSPCRSGCPHRTGSRSARD